MKIGNDRTLSFLDWKLHLQFNHIIVELGIDYISPEDHKADIDKPEQNGSQNGKVKQLSDPYDELIKNHLQKEEKIKVD